MDQLRSDPEKTLTCLDQELLRGQVTERLMARLVFTLEAISDKELVRDYAALLENWNLVPFSASILYVNMLLALNTDLSFVEDWILEKNAQFQDDEKINFVLRCARLCLKNGGEVQAARLLDNLWREFPEMDPARLANVFPEEKPKEILYRLKELAVKYEMSSLKDKVLSHIVSCEIRNQNWQMAEEIDGLINSRTPDNTRQRMNQALIALGKGDIYIAYHLFKRVPESSYDDEAFFASWLECLNRLDLAQEMLDIFAHRQPRNDTEFLYYLDARFKLACQETGGTKPAPCEGLLRRLYTYEYRDAPGARLFVFLSPLHKFMCYKTRFEGKILHLNENMKNWYVLYPELLVDLLLKYLFEGCRLVFIGSSLGAYAALLLSSLLKGRLDNGFRHLHVAISNICFSPQTWIYPYNHDVERITTEYKVFYEKVMKFQIFRHFAQKYGDLNRIFHRDLASSTWLVYGQCFPADKCQIEHFAAKENCHLCPLPDFDFHSTITYLYPDETELLAMRDRNPASSHAWKRHDKLLEYRKKYNYSFDEFVERILTHRKTFFEI